MQDHCNDVEERIEKIEADLRELKKKLRHEHLRRSAFHRLAIVAVAAIVIILLTLYPIAKYGAGDNLWQKAVSSWSVLAADLAAITILFYFILGKQKIRALGWPFTILIPVSRS